MVQVREKHDESGLRVVIAPEGRIVAASLRAAQRVLEKELQGP